MSYTHLSLSWATDYTYIYTVKKKDKILIHISENEQWIARINTSLQLIVNYSYLSYTTTKELYAYIPYHTHTSPIIRSYT